MTKAVRAYGSEQSEPAVTTQGDEMQVAAAVVTLEVAGHRKNRGPKSPTFQKPNMGHPPPASSLVVISRDVF